MFKSILEVLRQLVLATTKVSISKALVAAGDYAAEDVMSESTTVGTPWVFANIVRNAGGVGVITKAIALCSTTALTPRITVYLFTKSPNVLGAAFQDNAANTAVYSVDRDGYVGRLDFSAMQDLGGNSESMLVPGDIGMPLEFKCAPGENTLWGIAVTRDAITGEAAGMILQVSLLVREG